MNKKRNKSGGGAAFFARFVSVARERRARIAVIGGTFVALVLATYLGYVESNGFRQLSLVDFEIGKVAGRDVIASRAISYIDEEATKIRREARERLVTAVFRYDREITGGMLAAYSRFSEYLEKTARGVNSVDQFVLQVQEAYPGVLGRQQMVSLYAAPDRVGIIAVSFNVFKQIAGEGLAELPDEGLERFSRSDIELVRWRNDRQERAEVPIGTLLTRPELRAYVSSALALNKRPPAMTDMVLNLIDPFLKVNVVYQAAESEAKMDAAIKQVPPVLVEIEKGQRIIKQGFIITDEAYRQLEALASSGLYIDARQFAGTVALLLVILVASCYLFSSGVYGASLDLKEVVLLALSFASVYVAVVVMSRFKPFGQPLNLSVALPATLFAMLVSVIVGQRAAVLSSVIVALGVLCAGSLSVPPAIFSLFSSIAAVRLIRISGKRIDLVRSACLLAAINPVLVLLIALVAPGATYDLRFALVGAAFNGFMSGIFVLGFLPILESAMNTATDFRLMEFSDLNSPTMKKMLLGVSGTYNHSIMVATLAESACREIGANPLLARVGAYYHDVGKMDQSEYYVENQTDYNKHLDLNPRLSATVIRSHVKLGVEKARQLRLPQEVIDIISEHHGNSLIQYFYSEALKQGGDVDPEDFTYTGNPPRSKESAVVMLADVVEAACRTLDKPSIPRLERFINELVAKKIEARQLDDADLTFREVETIKRSFVSILAGYYHSRIEYPNQRALEDGATVGDVAIRGKRL
jgi:putative nucleotidyltransferase with HDIG domain